jgi:hypothetical protein
MTENTTHAQQAADFKAAVDACAGDLAGIKADHALASADIATLAATVAAQEKPRPSWQAEPCPSWCALPHRERDDPEDRYHDSEFSTVKLTTEPPEIEVIDGVTYGANDVPELSAELSQHISDAEPRVVLIHNDSNQAYMTLTEAEDMALGILSLVRAARRPDAPRPKREVDTTLGFLGKLVARAEHSLAAIPAQPSPAVL